MKKIWPIFVLLSFVQLHSQYYGNKILKIQYNETITYKSNIINNYLATLITKNELSYYKSTYKNTEKHEITEGEGEIFIDNNKTIDLSYEVYTNLKNKELTENKYENLFLKKKYSVSENYPKFKWELLKGSKKIYKYNCKKARTIFRGRTYDVYYTEEIPISIGPWKFNGLPGLILFAEDTSGIYKWEVASINYPFNESELDLYEIYNNRNKYNKITFKEFDLKFINTIKDKINTIKSRSSRDGMKASFSFSTFQLREPINEFRTQMDFD